jgi:hypothetical protein
MFAFANVVDFLPDELTSLGARPLAGAFVLARALQCRRWRVLLGRGRMNTAIRSTMLGAGLGAGLMFLFDPARGPRRRSLVRDKFIRATHETRDALGATQRDLSTRIEGVAAELRGRMASKVSAI